MHPEISYDPASGILTSKKSLQASSNMSIYQQLLGQTNFDDKTISFIEHLPAKMRYNSQQCRSISHGEIKLLSAQLGQGLMDRGELERGDIIMLIAPNSIEWVIVALAAQFAGLKLALASPAYATKELRHVYYLVQPKKVFIPSRLLINVTRARIPWSSVVSMDRDVGIAEVGFMKNLMIPIEEAKNASPIIPSELEETAFILFSSGTTGLPKGVEITHRNVSSMISIIFATSSSYGEPKRILTCLPFFHAMALILHVSLPLITRSTVSIQVPFNPDQFIKIIEDEKIQQTTMVPPILLLLCDHSKVSRNTFRTVEHISCGAAPLDSEIQKKFMEKTGTEVRQGWGMTETTVGCLGLHDNMTPGTCGRIMPGVEAKLVDPDTNQKVKLGQRGELWVRGPNIMKGYFRNEQATRAIKTPDGWLKTGDIAIVSDTADICVVDRIKELIKYKGNQIAPAELEALLVAHPKVAVAGVIGIYSAEQATELPRAYIQLKSGVSHEGVIEEILLYVRKNAGHAKWLRGGVRIVSYIPATPSGKILRKELRLFALEEQKNLSKL